MATFDLTDEERNIALQALWNFRLDGPSAGSLQSIADTGTVVIGECAEDGLSIIGVSPESLSATIVPNCG
jgi:hypothetical protein